MERSEEHERTLDDLCVKTQKVLAITFQTERTVSAVIPAASSEPAYTSTDSPVQATTVAPAASSGPAPSTSAAGPRPLFSSRKAFFEAQQPDGSQFSTFSATLYVLAAEANIADFTVDDLMICRSITACTDPWLREKMLEMEEPTMANLQELVFAYERSAVRLSAVETPTAQNTAFQVRPGAKKTSGYGECLRCS